MKKTLGQSARLKSEIFAMIAKTMEENGLSQGEVAKRMNIRRNNLNKVLRQRDIPTIDYLLRIAECIGIAVDMKFTVKGTETKNTAENRNETPSGRQE